MACPREKREEIDQGVRTPEPKSPQPSVYMTAGVRLTSHLQAPGGGRSRQEGKLIHRIPARMPVRTLSVDTSSAWA